MGYNDDNMPECGKCNCYNVGEVICWKCVGKLMQEQRMLGLKAGLEVAKDIAKREGFDFSFPDPEKIMIEDDDSLTNRETKE